MKSKYLLSILIILFLASIASFAIAANPALKFNLDATTGQATITPDLVTGTPYNYHAYQSADGSLLLGLTWIEGSRAKLAFYALPFKYSGEPLPVPVPIPPTPNPGPTPDPNPPTPGPNPPTPPTPPAPVAQPFKAIVLEETADSTQDFAQVRVSKTIRDYCKSIGSEIYFLDVNAKDKDGNLPKNYATWMLYAVGKKLPYVVMVDLQGNVLNGDGKKGEPSPITELSMLEYLQKFGGKNSTIPTIKKLIPCPTCPSGFRYE